MKKLLNTLYVLTPDSYLFCRNETICVQVGGEEKVSLPALSIDAIVCFGKNDGFHPAPGILRAAGHQRDLSDENRPFYGTLLRPGQRQCAAAQAPI